MNSILLGGQTGEGLFKREKHLTAGLVAGVGANDAQLLHLVHQLGGAAVAMMQGALEGTSNAIRERYGITVDLRYEQKALVKNGEESEKS